jgi:hypothetical protein
MVNMIPNEIICNILNFCEPTYQLTKIDKGFEEFLFKKQEYRSLFESDLFSSLSLKNHQRFYDLFSCLRTLNEIGTSLIYETLVTRRFDVFDYLLSDYRLHESALRYVIVVDYILEHDLVNFLDRLLKWKPPRGYKKYHKPINSSITPQSPRLFNVRNTNWLMVSIDWKAIKIFAYLISLEEIKNDAHYLSLCLEKCCRIQNLEMLKILLKNGNWTQDTIKMCISDYCIRMNLCEIFPLLIQCDIAKKFDTNYFHQLVLATLRAKRFHLFDKIYEIYIKHHPDEMLEMTVKSLVKHGNLNSLKMMVSDGLSPSWNNNWLIQKCSQYGLTNFVEYLVQFDNIDVKANNNFAWRKAKGSGYFDIVPLLENHYSFRKFMNYHMQDSFYE